MTDSEDYINRLIVSNPLTEPVVCSAIQSLNLTLGSTVLDAGCGIGLQTQLLAETVGPNGHVTGLDISHQFLNYAKKLVIKSGLSKRISFQQGDVKKLPFDNNAFDWAWSANCVGYAPMEPLPILKELARVVKPGGGVAIFAWSSENLIPGYPLLEASLNATSSGIAPFVKGKNPELHFLRALGWFRDAGLEHCSAQTFVHGVYAPLSDDINKALVSLFEMRWSDLEAELTQECSTEYQRLCLPDSQDFILNHPDYYAFYTCTLFYGRVVQ